MKTFVFRDSRLPDRFWSHVIQRDECWIWTAYTDALGYGRCSRGYGRSRLPHRVAYEALVGHIPDGLVIDHLCRVPSCVNPAHLEPVPQRANVQRGQASETQTARHAARTHCKRGHEFTPANTIQKANGRACRTCTRANDLARYHAKKKKKERSR